LTNLEIMQGAAKQWPLQIYNDDGSAAVGQFNPTDRLSASVMIGPGQTPLFNPSVSWISAGLGGFYLGFTQAQSTPLDTGGVYLCTVNVTRGTNDPISGGVYTVTILPGAGTGILDVVPYCGQADVEFFAPFLRNVANLYQDFEGLYKQCRRARLWLDNIIVSRARPLAYIFNIMTPLTPWGPVEADNYVIDGYLKANYLLVVDKTKEITARKAIAYLCENQITAGRDDPWPARSVRFHRSAENKLLTYRPAINISSAPSVIVTDPTGQGGGAQANAVISGGQVVAIQPRQFGSSYGAVNVAMQNGTGHGATATGIVNGGLVVGYTITSGGTGYWQKDSADIAFNAGMISWR
jgi:hypothetical protein